MKMKYMQNEAYLTVVVASLALRFFLKILPEGDFGMP